ncbi:uncharacterized protein STEHIDRAFT_107682 [Stereum hirsutum FP-91666 SS1]|uniref:uncharacterized protein n=1 Tax=Stereum hirsutum (strain FP-91666) TaxID=721885 RepID=UPI000440CC5D|nr:uncharacterized protein STEHIDRAFT_107682 [Stereum hirsutum FP-91666 SS1]EIM91016.1 hypothetical protein STEHIDRAFT_107682 [Stereum hirsutum FP-91666 SS1]
MQFFIALITLAATTVIASAANLNVEREAVDTLIKNPNNPADLVNCPPHGGADACHLEQPCKRIRINYGSPKGGHYIWYNYDITDIPSGVEIGTEVSCTDY